MQTRHELEQALQTAGVTGAAADLVLRETGPARHRARVEATLAAVREACGCSQPCDGGCELLLASDLIGVGGPGGLGGPGAGTVRAAWARGLGTGRRQAADGGAWMAAAREAMRQIQRESPCAIEPTLDWRWVATHCGHIDWAVVLVAECLRAAVARDMLAAVPSRLDGVRLRVEGSARNWAATFEAVCHEQQAAHAAPAPDMASLDAWLRDRGACCARREFFVAFATLEEAWAAAGESDLAWLRERGVTSLEQLREAIASASSPASPPPAW